MSDPIAARNALAYQVAAFGVVALLASLLIYKLPPVVRWPLAALALAFIQLFTLAVSWLTLPSR